MSRRLLVIIGLLASTILIPHAASAHDLCFADKSPYCFNDPFSDYWESNGGLPVFGYPITAAANETNADTGQAYLTQWAERNRFEVHPENAGTLYAILLGLLGKDRLRQLGRDPGVEPREAGPKDGCLWFDQTGHTVCNQSGNLGFKAYWETHGLAIPGLDQYSRSLQLFGLPLTEPRMETNSSGDTVLTQWFERARFEWHPNELDQYKVLLGLLGKELKGGTMPPLPPTAAPPPPTLPPALPPPSYNNCAADTTVAPNAPVKIVGLAKSASPETVTIQNVSGATVDLTDWKICSYRGNQLHATLSGTIVPGQTLTIASQASGPIWSNSDPDDAGLYDHQGRLISFWKD